LVVAVDRRAADADAAAVAGIVARARVAVVAGGALRIERGARTGAFIARFGAIGIAVGPRTRRARVLAARSGQAGVRAVAEEAVVACAAVRIGGIAEIAGLVARLRAVAVAVGTRARRSRVLTARS